MARENLKNNFRNSRTRIAEYVENHILSGAYAVGDALPSVRRLAQKFGVSYAVAYRAVGDLAGIGLLQACPSRGFIVRRRIPERDGERQLDIVVFLRNQLFGGMLIYAILQGMLQAARRGNAAFRMVQLEPGETPLARLDQLGAVDGAVLLHTFEPRQLPEWPLDCPAVGLLAQNSCGGRLSAVNLDPVDLANQAADFFRRRNIKHVIAYSSWEETYINRALAFQSRFGISGGTVDIRVEHPAEASWQKPEAPAFFFSSDSFLQYADENCRARHGRPLTECCTVLGVDGRRKIDPEMVIAPTIAYDYPEMGQVAFEELLRLIRNPETVRRNITFTGRLLDDNGITH